MEVLLLASSYVSALSLCFSASHPNSRQRSSRAEQTEHFLKATPAIWAFRAEDLIDGLGPVQLHQYANAMGATPLRTDCIHAVGIADHDFQRGRLVKNSDPHPVMPVA